MLADNSCFLVAPNGNDRFDTGRELVLCRLLALTDFWQPLKARDRLVFGSAYFSHAPGAKQWGMCRDKSPDVDNHPI